MIQSLVPSNESSNQIKRGVCFLHIMWILLFGDFTKINCSRNVFDHTNLPRLTDTDVIEVYHLRSFPLQIISTSVGTFSTQTSGLALRSTTTNEMIVLQYQPKNFGSCFLPKIRYLLTQSDANNSSIDADEPVVDRQNVQQMSNKKKQPPNVESHSPTASPTSVPEQITSIMLEWNKEAEIVYYTDIDTLYWQQSTFLARINGVVYKNYVLWIEDFILRNRLYSPQSICSSEYEFSCYTYSVTWDTFLEESIKVFAGLSVRINAIIPPRATELRYLSSREPIEVSMHHRRHKGDYWTGNGPDSVQSSEDSNATSTQSSATPISNDNSISARRHDSAFAHLRVTRNAQIELPFFRDEESNLGTEPNITAAVDSSYPDDGFPAPVDDLITYYRDIMACMQEFQLMDFTGALKSCSTENIAFVHIDGNRYYRISPRYPYVFVNEYLQYLPKPHYIDSRGIDTIDWIVLVVIIGVFVGGIVAALVKMQLIPLPQNCAPDVSGSTHFWSRKLSRMSYSSSSPKRNILFRIWGAMGWYSHYLKPRHSDGKGVYQHVNNEEPDEIEMIDKTQNFPKSAL